MMKYNFAAYTWYINNKKITSRLITRLSEKIFINELAKVKRFIETPTWQVVDSS